ncbi:unnamed protein product [Macrosiphum euphorbiae]|uniref:Uncharacterized protein n=1 Tax=Macrosiphum euphorbiae TaxID=13131 RepID=A0AAV0WQ70_9HEMI|nr:unnamed protein product [Macrosiphum euphorbiae]
MVECHDNYMNDNKDNDDEDDDGDDDDVDDVDDVDDDDDDDDDEEDKDILHHINKILSQTLDERTNHYLELKRSIEKTDREIKSATLKLNRQNKLVQMYVMKLKKKKKML